MRQWHTLSGRTYARSFCLYDLDLSRSWYGRGVKKSTYFLNTWEKVKWLTVAVESKVLQSILSFQDFKVSMGVEVWSRDLSRYDIYMFTLKEYSE